MKLLTLIKNRISENSKEVDFVKLSIYFLSIGLTLFVGIMIGSHTH